MGDQGTCPTGLDHLDVVVEEHDRVVLGFEEALVHGNGEVPGLAALDDAEPAAFEVNWIAVEFIADDELVEVTPHAIRIRKRILNESDRKRLSRAKAAAEAT